MKGSIEKVTFKYSTGMPEVGVPEVSWYTRTIATSGYRLYSTLFIGFTDSQNHSLEQFQSRFLVEVLKIVNITRSVYELCIAYLLRCDTT